MNYEYGKEYECNGVKPEGLADDTQVECWTTPYGAWRRADYAHNWLWRVVKKFRVTDDRYKPAPEQGWYDYKRRIRDGLPPAGIECEYTKIGSAEQVYWRCTIIAYDKGHPVVRTEKGHYHSRPFSDYKFRPLDWDRELKRERDRDETVTQAFTSLTIDNSDLAYKICQDLYEIGMLRPQEQKK